MSIKVSGGGGGGGGYPGVTGDGETPGGLTVAGALQAGDSAAVGVPTFHTIYGQVTVSGGQAVLDDGDPAVVIAQHGTLTGDTSRAVVLIQRQVNESGHALTGPVFHIYDGQAHSGADVLWVIGTLPGTSTVGKVVRLNNNGGLGLFGHAAPTAPRTLPQATIDAITDANAKAAVQALANALADMGALTLT